MMLLWDESRQGTESDTHGRAPTRHKETPRTKSGIAATEDHYASVDVAERLIDSRFRNGYILVSQFPFDLLDARQAGLQFLGQRFHQLILGHTNGLA